MQRQRPSKAYRLKNPRRNKNKIIVGVTGGFGCGKSTVASIFKSYGASVIDADKIARHLLSPGKCIYRKVVARFGKGILNNDKTINRKSLALVVFNDKTLLRQLNAIIHPAVIKIINTQINTRRRGMMVLDAPLLLEAGLAKTADVIVVVKTTQENQLRRIQKKSFLERRDILKRIKSQLPLRQKLRQADFVIDNNGNISEARKQVEEIWRSLAITR